jgi:hypothetical protein
MRHGHARVSLVETPRPCAACGETSNDLEDHPSGIGAYCPACRAAIAARDAIRHRRIED